MRALWVIGAILLALFLIGLVPIGLDAGYREDGLELAARIWFFSLRLGGGTEKAGKREKKPKAPSEKKAKSKRKNLPSPAVLKLLALNGYKTLCRLLAKLRVELLRIRFTSSWPDPALTAMAYGAAGAAMEGLLAVGGERIGAADLRADIDFDRGSPALDFRIRLSLRLFQLLGAALGFGLGALRDVIRLRKEGA